MVELNKKKESLKETRKLLERKKERKNTMITEKERKKERKMIVWSNELNGVVRWSEKKEIRMDQGKKMKTKKCDSKIFHQKY